jgi:hypothetical protein
MAKKSVPQYTSTTPTQKSLSGRPVDQTRETFTRADFLDDLKKTSRRTKAAASSRSGKGKR